MQPSKNKLLYLTLSGVTAVFLAGVIALIFFRLNLPKLPLIKKPTALESGLKKFTSEAEFKEYLTKSQQIANVYGVGLGASEFNALQAPSLPLAGVSKSTDAGAGRVSETNIQVKGIDEPDIVKTDGKNIFFSLKNPNIYFREIVPESNVMNLDKTFNGIIPPVTAIGITNVIKAFPPSELAKQATIDKGGEILLSGNILTVFTDNSVYGYDVSNPSNPSEKWKLNFENYNQLVSARLFGNKIYLVTKTEINYTNPCPIVPMSLQGVSISIPCVEIYHPVRSTPVDVTFTALTLDPQTGNIEKRVSAVGSSGQTVVYMSLNAIYFTYTFDPDPVSFIFNFFTEKGQDLIDSGILKQLGNLKNIDISSQAKMVELQVIYEKLLNSLSNDGKLKFENELQNRLSDYLKIHSRDLEKTGIVKINLNIMDIASTGEVPGNPLNQFSLDEYQGNLRIATTIGGGNGFWEFGIGNTQTSNDVYILDSNLKNLGQITDLGVGERIYSVRFIENKGYVVTFKQVDPFFVLDLSNPMSPQKKGELKIPGFSSYLDQIATNIVLGVGSENSKVKLSLFDVANPDNPVELSKYLLDEYWTEVSQNHHAFLLDPKHQVFFLPSGKGGYIFSYQNKELKLVKAVSEFNVKRAIYLNDYMYIIGEGKIVVVNENDWLEVNQLTF
ncbi:hypothetical protein A2627_02685 [Candidatus Woesebacteria bacterium RIFCSPHIGHO2_01_FULL_39_28]|uniref:Beta propeller domain-containing protein n=1 Tax=Candidatus Woesebacteria bacterium RIFCSPHIGHO2_01_FULL_39_28 TaxID=1802496 RepID=A0A1F7YBL2_9BACT|nr:MAG: hypothetical protein A2627_02685 [Candidatus Woesebacteria bacterium RIFCSPHIGHO2_01_FULL_39_28]OGM58409.1 MAG: hypothetical protein A3A50_02610 [Candidatus Woesebacteria bacterium RIFCSPLOWO2_01_FULL_38_20]